MNGKAVLPVIMAVLSLHQTVWGAQLSHSLQKRNLGLTTQQKTCIQTQLSTTNTDPACTTVRIELENAYNELDVAAAIGMHTNLFTTFCQPVCGQAIINAWGQCNLYDDVRSVAELLINMCSANGQRKCHQDYIQLFAAFADGSTCSADLDAGSCSTNCRTALTQDTQTYGCCINVPIKYNDAIDTAENIDAQANTLFTECRVTRPSACPAPANALGPPGTPLPGSQSTKPPSSSQSSSPPASSKPVGSGAGQPVAVAAFVLLNSLVAFVMHF